MKRAFTTTIVCLSLAAGSMSLQPAIAAGGKQWGGTSKKLFRGRIRYQLMHAESLLAQRKYDESNKLFKKMLRRNPRDVDAMTGLAMGYTMQFKLGAAEKLIDQALEKDPENALAHTAKATVLLYGLQSSSQKAIDNRDSTLKRAEGEALQALQSDSENPQAHYVLGMIQKEQGRLAEAQSQFQAAVDTDPEYSAGYTGLGMSQLLQNNINDAHLNFRRAINLYSGNSTAHFGMGEVLLKQGNADEAIKELNTALYQYRNSAPVHLALGKAYEMQGNHRAALKSFEKAVLIKPELKEAYKRMADLHVKLGQQHMQQRNIVGALKEFRQAILVDPYNPQPYLSMADMRESRGDLELAVSDLRNGLELNPDQPQLIQRVADNLLKLEKLDDAIKEYQKVLTKNPGNSQCIEGLTRALYLKAQKTSQGAFVFSNDYESATDVLKKAIQLKPNDMKLRLAMAKIRALGGEPVDLNTVGKPTNDPERISYAEALLAQNKFSQSAEQMREVIAHATTADDIFAIGDLALMIKDLDSAEMAYKKAETMEGKARRAKRGMAGVSKTREKARRQSTLGDDLRRRRMLPSAVDTYRQAIATNPRLADARYGLAEAERRLSPRSPEALRDSAKQYRAYLDLRPDLPEKQVKKLTKRIEKLKRKALKIEQKQQRRRG